MSEAHEDAIVELCDQARSDARERVENVGDALERIATAYEVEAALPGCREGWPKWARARARAARTLDGHIERFLDSMDKGSAE